MADRFYHFHHTPEQMRRFGARGGKATARNRRARSLGATALSSHPVPATELHVETTAGAVATLDEQFPWLRGTERRRLARPQHVGVHIARGR